jgi:acylaminoacyl-peptidase
LRLTAFTFALCAVAAYSAQQPFGPDDLWAWRSVSEPRITPDGRWVAYLEGWNDRVADARYANLWLVSADGKQRRRLTSGDWRDASPRWSPEGDRLAWVSDRGGGPRIFVSTLEGGAETAITLDRSPSNLAWSPDGKWIAFTAFQSGAATPSWAPQSILPFLAQPPRRVQVFVVASSGGAGKRVSTGDFDHGPPAWMPDGQWILTARAGAGICAFRAAGGEARPLTPPGEFESPLPSPDGARIAYLARDPKPQSYVVQKLYVMNADGSRPRALSGALDRDAFDARWSSDSRTLYFLADDSGATHVYAARADGSLRQATDAAERLSDLTVAANGLAAAVRSTLTRGEELVAFSIFDSAGRATLAAPNAELLASREIAQPQEIGYESAGKRVQAWLYTPPRSDPARRRPLLVDQREALRAMNGFEFNLDAQVLAARGFAVLRANPRGTPGYGEDFGNLLRTGAPGDDLDDLLSGVEFAIEQGRVDPKRVSLAGGLPAAWALGHSDRFVSIVLRRGKAWVDEPWDPQRSPILFARNFKTPTLVIADAPDAQSDQLFEALQSRKVDSSLVRLAGASPGATALELEAILAWLARW